MKNDARSTKETKVTSSNDRNLASIDKMLQMKEEYCSLLVLKVCTKADN